MDTRPRTRARRSYADFEPSSELVEEKGSETLLIELTGFTKEQARVQLEPTGNLKVSGERPLGDNKWSRFEKHFQVSSDCNTDEISATFEDGVLFIIMPKFINNTNQSSGMYEPNHDRPISQEKHSAGMEVDQRTRQRSSLKNQEEKNMTGPKFPQRKATFSSTLETPLGPFGYSKQSKLGDEKIKHGSKLNTITRRAGSLIQDCKHTSLGSMVVVAILVAFGISIKYARS
ncbi:inactive protein RESTRICTED TEV MOVEMENT 2-like [Papaver somniferum]|uniref:inactive protein RESTRICTED TEV MOVEMENT 2-like n=1 Tax=Papaver somniferum TaxID=3469 RepID=UPI000E703693|nr:inactive protein RESTRICTED TEV MOVEMENT 2-like [Papaver somniferum]